jgi:hypothetical protein
MQHCAAVGPTIAIQWRRCCSQIDFGALGLPVLLALHVGGRWTTTPPRVGRLSSSWRCAIGAQRPSHAACHSSRTLQLRVTHVAPPACCVLPASSQPRTFYIGRDWSKLGVAPAWIAPDLGDRHLANGSVGPSRASLPACQPCPG